MAKKNILGLPPLVSVTGQEWVPVSVAQAPPLANTTKRVQIAQIAQGVSVAGVSVKGFGATGNGATDDTSAIQAAVNFCFGTSSSPNGSTNAYLNLPLYFPAGNYLISKPITFRSVHGGRITGAGRYSTQITQTVSGSSCFVTNGFEFSIVEGMYLQAQGSGCVCFDLDWDNTGSAALQSNTFRDMAFGAPNTNGSDIGLRIGNTGYMGSENSIINCFFANCATAAVKTCNFNALSNTFYGGNIEGCSNYGIWVSEGSAAGIFGVGFQNGSANTFDIYVANSAQDVCSIIGCRSESKNFASLANSVHSAIIGCEHVGSATGTFVTVPATTGGVLTIERCVSTNGNVFAHDSPRLSIRGSSFGLLAWLNTGATGIPLPAGCIIEIEDVQYNGTPDVSGLLPATHIRRQRIDDMGTQNYVTTIAAGLFSALPASPFEGLTAIITDSSTATWGATISGSGGNRVLGYFNGSNWTVAAK